MIVKVNDTTSGQCALIGINLSHIPAVSVQFIGPQVFSSYAYTPSDENSTKILKTLSELSFRDLESHLRLSKSNCSQKVTLIIDNDKIIPNFIVCDQIESISQNQLLANSLLFAYEENRDLNQRLMQANQKINILNMSLEKNISQQESMLDDHYNTIFKPLLDEKKSKIRQLMTNSAQTLYTGEDIDESPKSIAKSQAASKSRKAPRSIRLKEEYSPLPVIVESEETRPSKRAKSSKGSALFSENSTIIVHHTEAPKLNMELDLIPRDASSNSSFSSAADVIKSELDALTKSAYSPPSPVVASTVVVTKPLSPAITDRVDKSETLAASSLLNSLDSVTTSSHIQGSFTSEIATNSISVVKLPSQESQLPGLNSQPTIAPTVVATATKRRGFLCKALNDSSDED